MLMREQFRKAIEFCQKLDERESKFSDALDEFQGNDDFRTSFCSNISSSIIYWLQDVMNDTDTISWWYYDCPEQGKCKNDSSCTIELSRNKKERKWVLRTIDDLYEYLLDNYKEKKNGVIIRQQSAGVGFALDTIREQREKNTKTKNVGYEDRNALFNFLDELIENRYILETGEQPNHLKLIEVEDNNGDFC